MSSSPVRRPRADAERNRAHLLDVARGLFAERGDEVQLPEVARAAGVGVGTVYRHFPTLGDLVEATAELRFAEIEEYARNRCLRAKPGQAVARYLRHVGETLAADRGLSAAIESVRHTPGSPPRGEARARLENVVGELVARDAGALRADCTVADVYLIAGALSATIRHGGDWRRLLDLALSGLSNP